RPSLGCNAPTPTTWRATSSPRSFLISTTTEYSHGSPDDSGWRIDPSILSGEKLGCAGAAFLAAADGSNRRYFLHAGQTLELSRITARQCGHERVAPGADWRTELTTRGRAVQA